MLSTWNNGPMMVEIEECIWGINLGFPCHLQDENQIFMEIKSEDIGINIEEKNV